MERVNDGGAMRTTTGVFTVPLDGLYHFQFSGQKYWDEHMLHIHLQVNGVSVAAAYADKASQWLTVALSGSFRLKKGDRVNLYKRRLGELYDEPLVHLTHFSGWLVEEELN